MSQNHLENLKLVQGCSPNFRDFMNKNYSQKIPKPFNIPDTIKFINIDLFTGKPTNQNFITESFKNKFNFDKI